MNILFVNNEAIYVLPKEEYEESPIVVFSEFYSSFGMHLILPFSEWLNKYILTENTLNLSDTQIKNKINTSLSTPENIMRMTLKLYPMQFDVIEDNWVDIKRIVETVIKNKRTRDVEIKSFEKFENFLTKKLGVVIHV